MIVTLQLLRFVAASLVVFHHAAKEFSGLLAFGEFGVDIFFVISGFIISHITQDNREQFFARRLIRIVPLYWLLTGAVAALAYVAPHLLRSVKWDVPHVMTSFLFIPWWTESLGFEPTLPMGWTLNYELWFYLLFYLAMRINVSSREMLCSLFIVGVYVSTNLLPLDRTAPLSFYADSIVMEFAVGMAIAVLYRKKTHLFEQVPRGVVLTGAIAALVLFSATASPAGHGDVPRCVYWGVPAGLCVMVCLCMEAQVKQCPRWLISGALVGGEISYPLYLMHMFVIAVLSRVFMVSTGNAVGSFLMALVLSSVSAYLVSHYVDQPMRRVLSATFLTRSSSV